MIRRLMQHGRSGLRGVALPMLAWVAVGGAPSPARPAPRPTPSATPAAPDPIAAATHAIDQAQTETDAIAARAGQVSGPIETGAMVARATEAARAADQGVAALAAALADGVLAPTRRDAISDAIARGGRTAAAAARLAAALRAGPGERIERTVAIRVASPLSARFWGPAAAAVPGDLDRLAGFLAAQARTTWAGMAGSRGWLALLAVLAAALLAFPVRLGLRRAGRRFMVDRIPRSRLRGSSWALYVAVLGAAVPWLTVLVLYEGFRAAGMVSAPWQPFAGGILRGIAAAAAVSSVASALLQRRQASWRLLPIGDAAAAEIRPWTIVAALAVFLTVIVDELLAAAGVSAPVTDVANLAETLLHDVVSVMLLLVIGRVHRRADAESDAKEAATNDAPTEADAQRRRALIVVAAGLLVGWITVAATLVGLAAGYVAFALLATRMLVWLPLVGASLFLACRVVDDLASESLAADSSLGRGLQHAFGVRASVIDQVGVSLSALARLLLLLLALVAAFAPFGGNLNQLTALADTIGRGATIGAITIAPGAIVRGLAVFAIGVVLVGIVERWLTNSYLPKTELDDGARNSISTIARYIGFILAASWGLAALGIGFERIALVLSALSVGIGFGLQAITQNFVSGLILLIERPVKIGDLVEINGRKGDVKRIRVRATEIQTSDRSTLIVPNSELITKTVRNMTHANPMGVVQLQFTVPLDTDVDAIRDLVLGLFTEAEAVFNTPEPKVLIDSLDDGAVHFNCTAYCSTPRAAYATRSDVLFRLITELRRRSIAIGSSASPGASAAGDGAPATPGTADDDDG